MKKEMFINSHPEECRIAVVSDGEMTELYTERTSSLMQVGNIYKGRVTNVEPSIQAAFVDFGRPKNGFLHISDVSPKHFPGGQKTRRGEAVGHKRARRDRPPIQACLKRGQELVVQVTKEGIGTKGATLTTYLSIPGRYLVLMPGMHRLGISRRIEEESVRARLRSVLEELKPPPELGFIVRTAGIDQPKSNLQRDLNYLLRLWKVVSQRSREARAPAELYQESDLVIRTIRDVYNTDVDRVVCDDEAVACKVREFLQLIMPRTHHRVALYEGDVGLYHAFGLEQEMDNIHSRRVPLAAGGSLVIDQTEALVAIDVNSGRFRETDDAETMALRINTQAAREAARQLRIRDLGGVIVIDFIDMALEKNRRQIERIMREQLRRDRAKTKQLRMSQFGIIEITRQRIRPSLVSSVFRPCARCAGSGLVKTEESQALSVMRTLRLAAKDERVARVELRVAPAVADYISNQRRHEISDLETRLNTPVAIHADPDIPRDECRIECTDSRGSLLQWDPAEALARQPQKVVTREITNADAAAFRKRQRAAEKPTPEPPPERPAEQAKPPEPPEPTTKKKKRRRRKKTRPGEPAPAGEKPPPTAEKPPEPPPEEAPTQEPGQPAPAAKKKSRSRRRRRKKKVAAQTAPQADSAGSEGAKSSDSKGS